jgi:Protein of unknown function (DUF1353)
MSRFTGKLSLVLLDNRTHPSTRSGRSLWGVQHELTYEAGDAHDQITVPKGFVTDLASIPRPLWSVYPPDGPWVKAAVIHDFLYFTQGDGIWFKHGGVARAKPYERREADDIFREAMVDRGIGGVDRSAIWAAVRVAGGKAWRRPRRGGPGGAEPGSAPGSAFDPHIDFDNA